MYFKSLTLNNGHLFKFPPVKNAHYLSFNTMRSMFFYNLTNFASIFVGIHDSTYFAEHYIMNKFLDKNENEKEENEEHFRLLNKGTSCEACVYTPYTLIFAYGKSAIVLSREMLFFRN